MPASSGKSFDALVLQIERKFIVLVDVKRLAKMKVAQLVIDFGSSALSSISCVLILVACMAVHH